MPAGVLSDDLKRITGNPEIKAVAQLVGGLEPARTIMLKLLESGKDVVTANKALLAEHGPELFDRARELGRSIAFEAAVAGGIPIIANISQCLSANQIKSLHGILNGTSNFILTQMEDAGRRLRRRRAPRPSGWATPRPTRRWTSTAATPPRSWRSWPTWRSAPACIGTTFRARGIDTLDVADMRYAKELGYRIKLLAVAAAGRRRAGTARLADAGARSARRWPKSAARTTPSASWATPSGRVFFHGLGAGQMPTASAVVADLIDTVVGRTAITFRTLELWSKREAARARRSDHADVPGRYYLRFNVEDRPGVLAEIAGVLGEHEHLDRLGHSARSRARRDDGRRAAGHHDAHDHRRGHATSDRGNRWPQSLAWHECTHAGA